MKDETGNFILHPSYFVLLYHGLPTAAGNGQCTTGGMMPPNLLMEEEE
jgi:hypothetical protein